MYFAEIKLKVKVGESASSEKIFSAFIQVRSYFTFCQASTRLFYKIYNKYRVIVSRLSCNPGGGAV